MGRKAYTRFVVEAGGALRRVFTVHQRKDGGLTITPETYEMYTYLPSGRTAIKEMKHSIHPSPKSLTGANNVHLTTLLADGSKTEFSILTHAARDGNFQPIYARAMLDPRQLRPFTPHAKDTVVFLGRYDPTRVTMLYAIWFSATDAAESFRTNDSFHVVRAKYSKFSLIVPYAFTAQPSQQGGYSIMYMTMSEERLTAEERDLGFTAGIAPGTPPDQVFLHIMEDFNTLVEHRPGDKFWIRKSHQQDSFLVRGPKFGPNPETGE